MKIRSASLVLSVLLAAGAVSAQTWEDCRNAVGIFTAARVPPSGLFDYNAYTGAPRANIQLYLVVLNPHSWQRNAALGTVGGYELSVTLPAGVFLLETTLPGDAVNALAPPDFQVTGNLPVIDDQCLLATLHLGVFTTTDYLLYLEPLAAGASLPGQLALRDGDAGGEPAVAFPVYGDTTVPVFAFWPLSQPFYDPWSEACGDVVAPRRSAFGAAKSLYR